VPYEFLQFSALRTHDAEDSTGIPMPMALSGRISVRSLAKEACVSADGFSERLVALLPD
jgi:hypothetical protein